MSRASCLVLILAAIIYWQILEIDSVLRHWDPEADGVNPALLPHISPVGWENGDGARTRGHPAPGGGDAVGTLKLESGARL
jgi:hypothetical protein